MRIIAEDATGAEPAPFRVARPWSPFPNAIRCAAVIGALLTALAVAPAAQAAFPGANGLLAAGGAFGCDGSMIATMRPDGSDFALLTPSVCEDEEAMSYESPDWSGDGRRLLANDRVGAPVLIDAATREVTRIPLPAEPFFGAEKSSLSRDGLRVAYTRQVVTPRRGSRSEVWISDVDGTNSRRLRAGTMPRISPDGRTIAYVTRGTSRGRTCAPGAGCSGAGTWLMSARTGKRIRRLGPAAGSLDWAPDGRRLVYSGARCCIDSNTDLHTVRVDGRGRRKLTATRRRAESGAVWSPDGRQIAYVARTHPDEEDVQFTVYRMRASGGPSKRVYRSDRARIEEGTSLEISWQPLPR
ncbi:MAG: tolB protein precursor, periplasmic protein involved in the tonb-independent uptake of group A colicins [uncultured Solirubrobacteraceae bacterium]|uniref:TolB protein, periplasmic protein involved in the tonb-independent uptake of group A colicins n=1 Tax=uncultured Solirubrobacteraceae bacterium TaxID=1162706 RepID=A0A6J4R959_9ACTN|nr:MAG: tolB protein precursor, periplasmic protein involved in the tonb-independent uptake of group A colicins [uncultured Solirubrobacteraceae bacterium]